MEDFIRGIGAGLNERGYLIEAEPSIPGLQSLLYARSPFPQRMAFARVEDHFLFLDWGNALFSHLDLMLTAHKKFSAYVNRNFRVPHAWRMTMPNLVTAAVSLTDFPAETMDYVHSRCLNHWAGGETGQLILIKLPERRLEHYPAPYRMSRQTGSIPLAHAVGVFREII